MNRARGAALLLVLWLVALLTALVGAYALTARMEALQGRVGSRGAVAQEVARAGMEYALVRVSDRNPETHWQPNGRAYAWSFDGNEVQGFPLFCRQMEECLADLRKPSRMFLICRCALLRNLGKGGFATFLRSNYAQAVDMGVVQDRHQPVADADAAANLAARINDATA